jgi:hypothetical protein
VQNEAELEHRAQCICIYSSTARRAQQCSTPKAPALLGLAKASLDEAPGGYERTEGVYPVILD